MVYEHRYQQSINDP